MEQHIEVGLTLSRSYPTGKEHSARTVGSGEVEVLSTPSMVAFMENTARQCVRSKLPEGYMTVGTEICVSHLKPVPIGEILTVTVQLLEIDRRKLTFKVKAEWRDNIIGEGKHERFIVNKERFLQSLREKMDELRT